MTAQRQPMNGNNATTYPAIVMDTQLSATVSPTNRSSRLASWLVAIVILLALYILSAGPVLALGCWLRDATGWEGFYAVFFLYLPLVPLSDVDLCEAYLMWWMHLFGTMPPG